jgi:hypothetical protein
MNALYGRMKNLDWIFHSCSIPSTLIVILPPATCLNGKDQKKCTVLTNCHLPQLPGGRNISYRFHWYYCLHLCWSADHPLKRLENFSLTWQRWTLMDYLLAPNNIKICNFRKKWHFLVIDDRNIGTGESLTDSNSNGSDPVLSAMCFYCTALVAF